MRERFELLRVNIVAIQQRTVAREYPQRLRFVEFTRGNKTRAAAALGVSVKTLYNKLGQYGLGFSNASAS